MELNLTVYKKGTREVEKVYTSDTCFVQLGTLEDILNVIDIDNIDDDVKLIKSLVKSIKYLKPLLKDVFDGVSDAELKRTNSIELVALLKNIVLMAIQMIMGISDEKN